MSPRIPRPLEHPETQYADFEVSEVENSRSCISHRSQRFWIILCAVVFIIAIALVVGLSVGLTRGSGPNSSDSASRTPAPPLPNINLTTGSFWQPPAGATWQIVLEYALNDTSPNVTVYDIDLFENPNSTIASLHALNRSVICYFSAGSYETFRPDSNQFQPSDYAKPLDGWPGEYWLNTNSSNVRNIMTERLKLAASKGCDGVDPDNIDGYENDTGLDLTTLDAIDYLKFLAIGAHSLNMSLGLKNAAEIMNQTIDIMQWAVNEQCEKYQECGVFQPFIRAGKPVFHIEYPNSAPDVSTSSKAEICTDRTAHGFSTILKDMDLDEWLDAC
ncbi:Glycoside hydrolase superfamily [Hyaloscypha variabilis]|jgi:endo-alpha-1,4-polygalactosaminidase (GH114 family)